MFRVLQTVLVSNSVAVEDKAPYAQQQGCIKFIKSVGEEYQVVKMGREYLGCGEE